MRTSTVIVSDVRLYREGLEQALDRDGRVRVLGMARSAPEALALVDRLRPETVLLDVQIPTALETVEALASRQPAVKVIALGLAETEGDVVACAEAGISGYVSRDGSVEELIDNTLAATREQFTCSRRVAAALLKRVRKLARGPAPVSARLTPREEQVAAALRAGLTNKEIAENFGIEVATVKNHVHNVLDKLGAKSRAEAAAMTRRGRSEGLLDSSPSLSSTPLRR